MCTKLPDSVLEERLRWVLPIVNKHIRLIDAAKVFPGGKRTLERWLAAYKRLGETGLAPVSTRPKGQPKETPVRIKERIIELRRQTKLCAKKLNYKLAKENITVSDRLIGKIIKTDNGSCFTNRYTGYQQSADPANPRLHPFDLECQKLKVIYYLIDPGKPAQNGKVERSHRTDQEMFYDRHKFKTVLGLERAIKQWNIKYNNLEHCSLGGKTPNEMILLNL